MNTHRIIQLACLLGAVVAPIVGAGIAQFSAGVAVSSIIPNFEGGQIPALTQTWVIGVTKGEIPIILGAMASSFFLTVAGIYALFSKRPTAEISSATLLLVCCVGYIVAFSLVGGTLLGIVLLFVPVAG